MATFAQTNPLRLVLNIKAWKKKIVRFIPKILTTREHLVIFPSQLEARPDADANADTMRT